VCSLCFLGVVLFLGGEKEGGVGVLVLGWFGGGGVGWGGGGGAGGGGGGGVERGGVVVWVG